MVSKAFHFYDWKTLGLSLIVIPTTVTNTSSQELKVHSEMISWEASWLTIWALASL
jgi:hypothetical protein